MLIEITVTDVSEDIDAHGQFLATRNGECAVYQLQYIKKWSEKIKCSLNKPIKVEARKTGPAHYFVTYVLM